MASGMRYFSIMNGITNGVIKRLRDKINAYLIRELTQSYNVGGNKFFSDKKPRHLIRANQFRPDLLKERGGTTGP